MCETVLKLGIRCHKKKETNLQLQSLKKKNKTFAKKMFSRKII